MNANRIVRGLSHRFRRFTDMPFQLLVYISKRFQRAVFEETQEEANFLMKKLDRTPVNKEFIEPHWEKLNKSLRDKMKHGLPFGFLRDPIIGYTMFFQKGGTIMMDQLDFLKKQFSQDILKRALREEYTGKPYVMEHHFMTSHNSIHLLYHLARWQKATHLSFAGISTIVEWGGGYGRMAVLVNRLKGADFLTYIIIDTPLFSVIQWQYLSSVLGKEKINLVSSGKAEIKKGKINLVPLNFVSVADNLKTDLFLSTWALSESSPYAQKYVADRAVYSAEHVLIGFQERNSALPNAEGVKNLSARGKIEDISFLPTNHYIFC